MKFQGPGAALQKNKNDLPEPPRDPPGTGHRRPPGGHFTHLGGRFWPLRGSFFAPSGEQKKRHEAEQNQAPEQEQEQEMCCSCRVFCLQQLAPPLQHVKSTLCFAWRPRSLCFALLHFASLKSTSSNLPSTCPRFSSPCPPR